MNAARFLVEGDAVSRSVALGLLLLSVASWVVIAWKLWLLQRAVADVARGTAAFWQARSLADARHAVAAFDRHALVTPFLAALAPLPATAGLAGAGDRAQRRTRVLRDALHAVLGRLQFGQVLLATVGAIAPFVGLLGTVWGIHHALVDIAGAGQITIERIAGPVGEALVMTAAGLAVAIPAVLAYNLFGRRITRIEAALEGFAQDLRDLPELPQG
ncbi:MotA/TolQ/ExbB proton channel family protein [Xylophilus sp. ASV27]|uniref:MotA/TolQ/ExbB proton channel family protein n=1 Tax=Xylophilus sp. ASV27 TaxID=2795129 RepID=UPI0018EC5555|nr:MotA/TolQ/ExbB proton channel family protein [Xylophilus sp. ASV27]